MHKSDSGTGHSDHTPEHEAEVNEPLELDIYEEGGEMRFTLYDSVTRRSVNVNEEAFIATEGCR